MRREGCGEVDVGKRVCGEVGGVRRESCIELDGGRREGCTTTQTKR